MVVKERKTAAEAVAAGRIPSTVEGTEVQPDSLIEIKPVGKTGGEIVWEWHLWDHLIQDVDKDKANFGDVVAHPERVDINFNVVAGRRANPDWSHFNAVCLQRGFRSSAGEFANVRRNLDYRSQHHSTKEASGRTGGKSRQGRGPLRIAGEILRCIEPEQLRTSDSTDSTTPTGFRGGSKAQVTC